VAGARALGNPSQLAWAAYLQGEAVLDRDPRRAADLLDEAIALAAPVGNHFVHGVSLVSACSAGGRSSDPHAAVAPFRDAIDHWSRAGDRTHQWTTLRNLVEVLARTGADEAAAVILAAGAASPGAPPVYGIGAERLAQVERSLRQRLGPDRFARARRRGRGLDDDAAVVAFALEVLDGLGAPPSPAGRVLDGEQVVDQPRDETAAVEPVPDLDERPQLPADELADGPGVARPGRADRGGDAP
jgi:hypothetical protein